VRQKARKVRIDALNLEAALGRVKRTVEAWDLSADPTPTNSANLITEYTYDGNNHVLTMRAVLPAGLFQTTQYVYGVTTGVGQSDLNSNDLLKEVRYPDKSSGNPGTRVVCLGWTGGKGSR
jgi:hypothetical protein